MAQDEGNQERLAYALDREASAYRYQGNFAKAELLFHQALSMTEDHEGRNSGTYSNYLNNLALVVRAQGRYAEAEGLYREALEIGRVSLGEAHPSNAIRLGNLGNLLGRWAV